MFALIISRSGSKLGRFGSKTSSPGQIKEKILVNTLEVSFLNIAQNVFLVDF